jgi:shikimate kinase
LKARGVALKDGYTLKDLYEERTPLYEKYADIAVDLDGLSVLECAEKVCKAVQQ